MEEKKVEVKKPRAYQGGLVACVIVIVVLGGMFYSTYQSQLNQLESLKSQVNSLTRERNSLQSQITDFQDQVNSLRAEVGALQSEYNELDDIVNLKKSMVLDKDKTLNIPARGLQTLSYSTAYAGYIIVDFTASGRVLLMVGSGFTGEIYYRTSGATFSELFTIPILPGKTHLSFLNEGIIRVTVTLTVTYIY